MLRQKRYFVACVALILMISGCGLKGPLYQKDQAVSKNALHSPSTATTSINNSHAKQE